MIKLAIANLDSWLEIMTCGDMGGDFDFAEKARAFEIELSRYYAPTPALEADGVVFLVSPTRTRNYEDRILQRMRLRICNAIRLSIAVTRPVLIVVFFDDKDRAAVEAVETYLVKEYVPKSPDRSHYKLNFLNNPGSVEEVMNQFSGRPKIAKLELVPGSRSEAVKG